MTRRYNRQEVRKMKKELFSLIDRYRPYSRHRLTIRKDNRIIMNNKEDKIFELQSNLEDHFLYNRKWRNYGEFSRELSRIGISDTGHGGSIRIRLFDYIHSK